MLVLPRMRVRALTGDERVALPPGFEHDRVRHFWSWACSDVLNNTLRGLFAEWLVATALRLTDSPRQEWAAVDLRTSDGVTIEVKSAAYIQSWAQKRPSAIRFGIAPTSRWDPDAGRFEEGQRRQADVYVFCLLAEQDPERLDPLDASQWRFFVLPTRVLNERCPTQKSLALSTLRSLGPHEVTLVELAQAVRHAASSATSAESDDGRRT